MKTKAFLGIAWRIVLLFTIAMLFTFIPEQLRDFFGDTPVIKADGWYSRSFVEDDWNWGVRHYWYFWMMFFLFILSLISLIVAIANILRKNYNIKLGE